MVVFKFRYTDSLGNETFKTPGGANTVIICIQLGKVDIK